MHHEEKSIDDLIFLLRNVIIQNSHIVLTSGKHSSSYFNKNALYPNTATTFSVCEALAMRFPRDHVDTVIAPAMGGIILSQWISHHLSCYWLYEVAAVYAEKSTDGQSFIIRRGYEDFITNKNVLVVDDVLTTGQSAKKVVEAVRQIEGRVVGLGALCNRGGIKAEDLGVPKLEALINLDLEAWEEADCPLCKSQVPINTRVGKGQEFLIRQAEQAANKR